MKYGIEMSRGGIVIHTRFHKDWHRHSEVNRNAHTTWLSYKPFLIFSK
jgi:hypothetical protein